MKTKQTKKKPRPKPTTPHPDPAVLKTRVALVLDRSGSMGVMRQEAVDVFNAQVKVLRAKHRLLDTKVSLFTFATTADAPKVWNQPPEEIKPLTLDDYKPDGMTAMYDSVALAAEMLAALPEASEAAFLILVISDGQENNSKRVSGPELKARLAELQATGRWTITYLGANVNLDQVAANMGIPRGNTMAYAASSAGMSAGGQRVNSGTRSYMRRRASGQSVTQSFYQPDIPAKDEDEDSKLPASDGKKPS